MAHRRDDRRTNYLKAVGRYFSSAPPPKGPGRAKTFKVWASKSGLDEVLYDPERLVCAPGPGEPFIGDDDPIVPAVRELVEARLAEGSARASADAETSPDWRTTRSPSGLKEGERLVFDLPPGIDSASVAEELERDERWKGRCAPIYYTLFQQTAQPGEDPEAGYPVLGLPPLLPAAATPDDAGLGRGVTVAVIDTGMNQDAHASLGQHFRNDFEPRDRDLVADPADQALLGPAAGHGTFIAGLIHCVAPGALVRSYLVANPLGFSDEEDIAEGIQRAVRHFLDNEGGPGQDKALVINLSLGGYPFAGQSDLPELRRFAVLEAAIAGIPEQVAVVAAAGNCGSPDEFYPAAFDQVVGVAALDDCRHELWDHSNYGPWVKACASGVNLRGLFVEGKENPEYDPDKRPETWAGNPSFSRWSGTSFAAPLVAAQIAIVAAALGQDGRTAAQTLLSMSKAHPGSRPCGRRVMVDLPGQT